MAISKKGLRKIIIEDEVYWYKITRSRLKSDWRYDTKDKRINKQFLDYALLYGLGDIADIDVRCTIIGEASKAKLFIVVRTILVGGFLGPEQLLNITPKHIADWISQALKNKWNPNEKGDMQMAFLDKGKEGMVLV